MITAEFKESFVSEEKYTVLAVRGSIHYCVQISKDNVFTTWSGDTDDLSVLKAGPSSTHKLGSGGLSDYWPEELDEYEEFLSDEWKEKIDEMSLVLVNKLEKVKEKKEKGKNNKKIVKERTRVAIFLQGLELSQLFGYGKPRHADEEMKRYGHFRLEGEVWHKFHYFDVSAFPKEQIASHYGVHSVIVGGINQIEETLSIFNSLERDEGGEFIKIALCDKKNKSENTNFDLILTLDELEFIYDQLEDRYICESIPTAFKMLVSEDHRKHHTWIKKLSHLFK